MTATTTFSTRDGLAYGLLGLPLAFVALPLYVVLPHHYASTFGLPLATLGAVLLGARLLDAFTDPLIGRWTDRRFSQSPRAVLALGGMAAVLLALFLYVGRVAPEKNIGAFLDLDLPGSKRVVGDGPQRAELQARYPQVEFLGYRQGAALAEAYGAASA